jgi:glycine dehydrogenase
MAACYGMYHGPTGLTRIAKRVRTFTLALGRGSRPRARHGRRAGLRHAPRPRLGRSRGGARPGRAEADQPPRLRRRDSIGVTLDETADRGACSPTCSTRSGPSGRCDADALLGRTPGSRRGSRAHAAGSWSTRRSARSRPRPRCSATCASMQDRDLSLAHNMIPLGSCTMKLNATSEMIPVTWPEFGQHPPVRPATRRRATRELFAQLESWLCEITGFHAVSLQPNAGSQGEYAGLLAIRGTTGSRGEGTATSASSPTPRTAPTPAARHGGDEGRRRGLRPTRATSTSPTCAPRPSSTRPARRADGHLPEHHGVFESHDPRDLRSSTSTAGRSTWTART